MKKIVVVEPDLNCREMTKLFLARYANGNKYEVSAFPGCKEALDSCKSENPCLIICDNHAAGWTELAKETPRYYPRRKFILTLDPLPQEETEVLKQAEEYQKKGIIDDYVLKPVLEWDEFFPQTLKGFKRPYSLQGKSGLAEATT